MPTSAACPRRTRGDTWTSLRTWPRRWKRKEGLRHLYSWMLVMISRHFAESDFAKSHFAKSHFAKTLQNRRNDFCPNNVDPFVTSFTRFFQLEPEYPWKGSLGTACVESYPTFLPFINATVHLSLRWSSVKLVTNEQLSISSRVYTITIGLRLGTAVRVLVFGEISELPIGSKWAALNIVLGLYHYDRIAVGHSG